MTTYTVSNGYSTEVTTEDDHEDSPEEAALFSARQHMNPDNHSSQKMTIAVSYYDSTIGTRTETFDILASVEIRIVERR